MFTSFRFADKDKFSDERCKHWAGSGMRTFLILGQPTQLRISKSRSGRLSMGSTRLSHWIMSEGPPLGPAQSKLCMLTHPLKFTWVRWVQQARSSSIAGWHMKPYERLSSRSKGKAPCLQRGSREELVRYLQACSLNTLRKRVNMRKKQLTQFTYSPFKLRAYQWFPPTFSTRIKYALAIIIPIKPNRQNIQPIAAPSSMFSEATTKNHPTP